MKAPPSINPRDRILFALALTISLGAPAAAVAHPLGNDSITHFNVLYILHDRVEIDLVLDIAESQSIVIRREEMDTDRNAVDSTEEQKAWLDRKAEEFKQYLTVKLDGKSVPVEPVDEAADPKTGKKVANSRVIVKTPGFAGMPTYRLLIRYVARFPEPLSTGRHELEFKEATFPQTPGLKRILLERTTWLFDLNPDLRSELDQPEISASLRGELKRKELELTEEGRLTPDAPGEQWLITDAENSYAIVSEEEKLRVYKLPRIEIHKPRPAFWDEGLIDPFIYEQYDPNALPDEGAATIRFDVIDMPQAQPATGDDSPERRDLITLLNDPRNDPSRLNESRRQATRLLDYLTGRGEAEGRGRLYLLLMVTILAFGWGAAHALMPGHAKTIVAAYLISRRGTYWHAIMLAVIVTVTHTMLVVVAGLVMWIYQESHPEIGPKMQNYLGIIAGLLVAGMGMMLAWRALTGRLAHHHHDHTHTHDENRPWWKKLFTHSHPHVPGHEHHHHDHGYTHDHDHHHDHDHDHEHGHAHSHSHVHHHDHDHSHAHDHSHSHAHSHTHAHGHGHTHDPTLEHVHPHEHATRPASAQAQALNFRTLLALGVAGGIVPCPTATIIMLLGIGANVVVGALYAVGIFSLGLALTLMTVGFLALGSRKFATKILADETSPKDELSGFGKKLMLQVIPIVSGVVVIALGLAIAANYFYLHRTGRVLIDWLS